MIACVTVQEKITYGFENALNYSSDDFHEHGHANRIRRRARKLRGVQSVPDRHMSRPWARELDARRAAACLPTNLCSTRKTSLGDVCKAHCSLGLQADGYFTEVREVSTENSLKA